MLKSVDLQVGDQVSTLWAAVRAVSLWTPNTPAGMLKSVDLQVGDQVSTLWAAVRAVSFWTPNAGYAEVC